MLLSVEELRVSYGNIKALHGLNFEIDVAPVKARHLKPFRAWCRQRRAPG
jgi:hypothetical protein